jgi:nucleoside-diphosphate-sugar epimerase
VSQKRALVTGVAGLVGSHLADRLVADGWEVTGVDDLSGGNLSNVSPAVDMYINDFAAEPILRMVRDQKFDVVFHQAARPRVLYSIEHMAETEDINVLRTLRLAEACIGNIAKFVFASSSSVYGSQSATMDENVMIPQPISPYALQKLTVERYLGQLQLYYKLDSVSLRYFNVYGPRARGNSSYMTAIASWLEAIYANERLRLDGNGEQRRDLVYVSDVVEANILAGDPWGRGHECSVFNVGTGHSYANIMVLANLVHRFGIDNDRIDRAPFRRGDVSETRASTYYARDRLGFEAKVNLSCGLDLTIDWWEQYVRGTTP